MMYQQGTLAKNSAKIIDLGNISQPGENLLTGHRLLWFIQHKISLLVWVVVEVFYVVCRPTMNLL